MARNDGDFTCSEESDRLQVGELLILDLHLVHGPDILLHFADGRGHLLYPRRGQLLLRHRGLQVGDDGREDALEVHVLGALRDAQNEEVGPRVADEPDLGVVTEGTGRSILGLNSCAISGKNIFIIRI